LTKPIAQKVQKPVRVKIPHSLFSVEEDEHSICLFCKTDDKEAIEKYLEDHPITGLDKVLSMNDVKKMAKEFKQRKALLQEHSHFLCHTSIARQLYNALGNDFAQRNHFPVQIAFDTPNQIATAVNKAIQGSTYVHLAGNNLCIQMGKTSLSANENTANIVEGLNFAIEEKLTNGWSDVHSIHLKTKDSASLPIYTKYQDEVLQYVKAKTEENKKSKVSAKAPATTSSAPVVSHESTTGGKKSKRSREEEPTVAAAVPVEEPEQKKVAKKSATTTPSSAVTASSSVSSIPVLKKKAGKK
jgi:ribosome biogenesis protein UTP30